MAPISRYSLSKENRTRDYFSEAAIQEGPLDIKRSFFLEDKVPSERSAPSGENYIDFHSSM